MAPRVFRLNDEGYNDTDDYEVADDEMMDASRGVLACPESAIKLVDSDGVAVSEQELRRIAGLDSKS